jgi:PhzF family phenazine biosynthesis protein
MTIKLPFVTLDVFTTTRYLGNPLAVVTLPSPDALSHDQLQKIAAEFNLSETVFIHPPSPENSTVRRVQIFTTEAELPLAGHPLIGTATYLLKVLGEDVTQFETKGGPVPLHINKVTGNVKAQIPQAFIVHEGYNFKSKLNDIDNPVVHLLPGMNFILVELPSLEALAKAGDEGNGSLTEKCFNPELYIGKDKKGGLIGTKYFTANGKDESGRQKYRTRMISFIEDAGTGSACSALACWLAKRDGDGERKYLFEQGVEMGRRNEIYVDVDVQGGKIQKVVLSGAAVLVQEGTIEV